MVIESTSLNSQAVVVDKTVYLSGQIGIDPQVGINLEHSHCMNKIIQNRRLFLDRLVI